MLTGLERYRHDSLVLGAAALSLWPPNADRHVALAELIDALANSGEAPNAVNRRIGVGDWRRWLASRASGTLRAIQPAGLHDAPICVETALVGRRVSLIGGDLEHPDLHYTLWAGVLNDVLESRASAELHRARDLLSACATLCDRVVRASELGSYRWPNHGLSLKLREPGEAEYEQLCDALIVPERELVELGVEASALAPLMRRAGDKRWRPLQRLDDGALLIADPWRLSISALVRASAMVIATPQWSVVQQLLHRRALEVSAQAAQAMGWEIEERREDAFLARADVDCRVLVASTVCVPAAAVNACEIADPPALRERYTQTRELARAEGAQHSLLAVLSDGRAIVVGGEDASLNADRGPDPWLLGLGDLRLLGDGLRHDRLALPCALERAPRGPWPENCDLVDVIGAVRREEEPIEHRQLTPRDGTEHLHMRARIAAARHPAPSPRGSDWCEVSRWPGTPDQVVFHCESEEELSLLVRAPGIYVWVEPTDRTAHRHSLAGTLTALLAFWLARVFEAIMKVAGKELLARIEIELCDEQSPALAVAAEEERYRLIVGPALIESACRGDNEADRMLLAAALHCLGLNDRALVDAVAPAGRGTMLIWPSPEIEENPPRHEPPPLIAPRDRAAIASALAASVIEDGKIAVLSDERVRPALLDLSERLQEITAGALATLAPSSLLELLRLHEAALAQSEGEEISLPAREALSADDPEPMHLGTRESAGPRNVALRSLIERASAAPPTGERELGLRAGGFLRSAVELQVELGSAADFCAGRAVRAQLVIGAAVGVTVSLTGALPRAGEQMFQQLERSAPDLIASEHHAWWSKTRAPMRATLALEEPIDLEGGTWATLDAQLREEWGIGFEQTVRLLRALSDLADRAEDGVTALQRSALVDALAEVTAIPTPELQAGVQRLTLGRCADYASHRAEHAPWRAFRERSYLRRPLAELDDGRLAWSSLHVLTCARYLFDMVDRGRLRGSPALLRAVGAISQASDREFEAAVLRRVKGAGWEALGRVRKVGGHKLERSPGQGIGDIDVLAWHVQRGEVLVLECKRLAPGLNAGSSAREHEALKAASRHHGERLAWMHSHRGLLAKELDRGEAAGWEIAAAIVLDRPLIGGYLAARELLPVWTMWELPRLLRSRNEEETKSS